MYSAVLSPESFRMAGRSGMNLMMSAAFGATAEQAQTDIAEYRIGREEAGFDPAGGKIACLLMVYVADSVDRATRSSRTRSSGTTRRFRSTWPTRARS
jgi:alkanesulfonate monooxygenase SsuD/methylene tetrahydromethanopterin reductase-like flavin-dependent oxidoreductase (luciferase family)